MQSERRPPLAMIRANFLTRKTVSARVDPLAAITLIFGAFG